MLRILSDLHFYDGASRLQETRQLEPLLAGVQHLIINGDSCDTMAGATPEQVAHLRHSLESQVPQVTWITGNHDPDISEVHELQLEDGRVWISHGDVLFPDATPWSRLAPDIHREIERIRQRDGITSLDLIETRLRVFREVARHLPHEWDLQRRDLWMRLRRLLAYGASLPRLTQILRAWHRAPDLAAALARSQRPTAQVCIFGHIHRPSVDQRGGRTIINTGAYGGSLGAYLADITPGRVRVHAVMARRDGAFTVGRRIADIPLAPLPR